MSDRRIPQVARDLIAAKRLIEDPANWCKYSYGLNGGPACAVGAIMKVSTSRTAALDMLNRTARTMAGVDSGRVFGASAFNDLNDHAAVMEMFTRAIEMALQESSHEQ